ncbi:vacuolar protein sorting-associated protein 13 [Trichonephila clavipes]|nr:vacuolar protein sorting-associated protein 13 [Trichonephila clavipes]
MQLLPWPTYSPNMSPIEHMWDLVGWRLVRDLRPAASKDKLLLRIQITLSQDDYNTVMSVLNENLTETAERQSTAVPIATEPVDSKTQATPVSRPSEKSVVISEVPVKVHRRFKFAFVLRSVLVTLCHGDTPLTVGVCERKGSCSMAEVEVKVLEAHAEMMTDSSMLAQVFLTDVRLDDTRKTRKTGITRLMQRLASDTSGNMIHIEFNQNSSGDKRESNTKQTMATTSHSISDDSLSQATGSTVIFLKVQKPDIVLVENIEDEDSNAIFLNV